MIDKISQEIYDQVAEELLSNNIKPGLWARALADSDGDEAKAKSSYIKYRAREINSEIEELQQEALRQKEAQKKKNYKYKPVPARLPDKKKDELDFAHTFRFILIFIVSILIISVIFNMIK